MKPRIAATAAILLVFAVQIVMAGGTQEVVYSTADTVAAKGAPVSIEVTPGEHFEHKMRILPLIRITNNPQMAIWAETADGEYLSTLFVTERVAEQSWRKAPGDETPKGEIRRPEALPIWSSRRGDPVSRANSASDRPQSTTDAVSGATPEDRFVVATRLPDTEEPMVVYLEVNMSTDFNEAYPSDAAESSDHYSGGEWGSGQPALVYQATISTHNGSLSEPVQLELVGHSSPDGTDGRIYRELDGVTTAQDIVSEVWVYPETDR